MLKWTVKMLQVHLKVELKKTMKSDSSQFAEFKHYASSATWYGRRNSPRLEPTRRFLGCLVK